MQADIALLTALSTDRVIKRAIYEDDRLRMCRACKTGTVPTLCSLPDQMVREGGETQSVGSVAWPLQFTCAPCSTAERSAIGRSLSLTHPHGSDFESVGMVFDPSRIGNGKAAPRQTLEYTFATSRCAIDRCKALTHFYLTDKNGYSHFTCLAHVSGGTQKQVREVYELISAINDVPKNLGADRTIVTKGRQLMYEAAARCLPVELRDLPDLHERIWNQANKEWFGVNPLPEAPINPQSIQRHAHPTFQPWWDNLVSNWGRTVGSPSLLR